MNNDFYYRKYLKYKTKYLEEKNRIEGGGCYEYLYMDIRDIIKPLQYFDKIKELMQSNDKESIIKFLEERYNSDVFTFLSHHKDCLAPALLFYLEKNQQNLQKYAVLDVSIPPLKEAGSITTNRKLTFTSLNIQQDKSGVFSQKIVEDTFFSKGTAFLSKRVTKKNFRQTYTELERNLRYLANLMFIKCSIGDNTFVESLRFGTPYAPKGAITFYDIQIDILKKYVGNKICFFFSLLDPCVHFFCRADTKIEEQKIIEKELERYNEPNFYYLNLSCNNGVNLSSSLTYQTNKQLQVLIKNNIEKLKKLLKLLTQNLDDESNDDKKALKELVKFFDNLENYVISKDKTNDILLEKLKIRKFVLRKKPKVKEDLENFEIKMNHYSPCEEDLTNEHIGLVMFCYLSLVFYLLSKIDPGKYILLYHCKSGQDRTGTFFAINQMVNQITTENYSDIIKKICEGKTDFIDIFFEYYSLTKKENPIPMEDKYCPEKDKKKLDVVLKEQTAKEKINTNVELCYLRYLLFSYLMTITSTGIPGIKWGLTNTNKVLRGFNKRKYDTQDAIDNRYGYLILKEPILPLLFEGASQQRGA